MIGIMLGCVVQKIEQSQTSADEDCTYIRDHKIIIHIQLTFY